MARSEKVAAVAELTNRFTNSSGAVLTEYRGLTVAEMTELRRTLGDEATYAVSKNTLTKIAAKDAGIPGLEEQLLGPTAIAFIDGDPVTVAKGLRGFARSHPELVIKGGVIDGAPVDAATVNRFADLESRETLLGRMAGAMQGSLSKAAALFNAPLAQAARAVGALESKAQDDPSAIAGTRSAPESQPGTNSAETAGEAGDTEEN
jgi:large subunit ribosomal protein L10